MILSDLQVQSSGQNAAVSQLMPLLQYSKLRQQALTSISDVLTISSSEPHSSGPVSTDNAEFDHTESREVHGYIHQAGLASTTKQLKREGSRTRLRVSFRLPTWLCSRIWEVTMTTTQFG